MKMFCYFLQPIAVVPPIKASPESLPPNKGWNALGTQQFTAAAKSPIVVVTEATKSADFPKIVQPFVAPEAAEPTEAVEEPTTPSFVEAPKRTYAEELSKTPEGTKDTAAEIPSTAVAF